MWIQELERSSALINLCYSVGWSTVICVARPGRLGSLDNRSTLRCAQRVATWLTFLNDLQNKKWNAQVCKINAAL